jgi:hypothetical protein
MRGRKLICVILAIVVMGLVFLVYSRRFRLEAWGWHVRNGNKLTISNYTFPIPSNWYETSSEEGQHLLLRSDTDDHSAFQRTKMRAGIMITLTHPVEQLVSKEQARLESPTGRENPVLQRT